MKRLINSFKYAFEGIFSVLKSEPNMRIHCLFSTLVIILGIYFNIKAIEWCVILLCIMIVIVTEIVNTVFEKYLDFYHPEINWRVKILKDISAGAVLISAIFSSIIGFIIFYPYLFNFKI